MAVSVDKCFLGAFYVYTSTWHRITSRSLFAFQCQHCEEVTRPKLDVHSRGNFSVK